MPTLWVWNSDDQTWKRIAWRESARELCRGEGFSFNRLLQDGKRLTAILLHPEIQGSVNGQPLVGAIRILSHKDEILIGRQRFAYSIESRPEVTAFALATDRRPRCAVCRSAIEDGQAVVQCPGCGRSYHQIDSLDDQSSKCCWTYHESCKFCEHPTSLSGDRAWQPSVEDGGE